MDYVQERLKQEATKVDVNNNALLTPLNLVLLGIFVYTASAILRPSPPPAIGKDRPAIVFQTFTPRTLRPFDGQGASPVYLAVRGRVFDVTPGRNFYGPGGPYANFAGHDASRGLACSSFDEDMLTKDLDGPLDTLADLGPDEMDSLRGWEERFMEKYLVVGRLVAAGDEGRAD